jgi:N-acyl-D-aspartate/D-glutamate deacylase
MRQLAAEGMAAGAIGVATTTSPTGRNCPTRHAGRDEVVALMEVLARLGRGVGSFVPGRDIGVAALYELQRAIGRPFTWTALLASDDGTHRDRAGLHCEQLAAGADVHPQVSCRRLVAQATLASAFALRCPAVVELDRATLDQRVAAYRDPVWRRRALTELEASAAAPRWSRWAVAESARHPELVGANVAEVAAQRGVHPLDFVLDVSLSEQLTTRFTVVLANDDEDEVRWLLNLEGTVLGLSDAGAHPDQLCDAVMPTDLLGGWVRERGALLLERAIRKLSGEQSDLLGLSDRGYLLPGMAADVVVFDQDRVGPGPLRRVRDLPAAGERLVADAPTGMVHVLVNGTPITRDGRCLIGELDAGPGRVLRGTDAHPATDARNEKVR